MSRPRTKYGHVFEMYLDGRKADSPLDPNWAICAKCTFKANMIFINNEAHVLYPLHMTLCLGDVTNREETANG